MSPGERVQPSCRKSPMGRIVSTFPCLLFLQGLICASQAFNEIMQMLYKRFTDKSAEEWRQIYKVLPIPFQKSCTDVY